jgi:hypothetical protein
MSAGTHYLLLALFALLLPQALGFLGYRWTRHKGIVFRVLPLLISPSVFFISAHIYWGLSAESIRDAGGYVCGAFGAAAVFSTIYGTLINLVIGVMVFLVASISWRRRSPIGQSTESA